jgi:RNA 2',3'-cyclic 3'-phosphodiesterase
MACHRAVSQKPESLVLINAPVRCFIAVDIPNLAKSAIGKSLSPLRESMREVKWVEPDNLHLTLKFLGNVQLARIGLLKEKLFSALKDERKFSIRFSGIGFFPEKNDPKILWLGIDEGEASLRNLAMKIEEVSFQSGFEKEIRPFSAHLTLGRVRDGKDIQQKTNTFETIDFSRDAPIELNRLTIFKSILTPQGPHYEPLSVFNLI